MAKRLVVMLSLFLPLALCGARKFSRREGSAERYIRSLAPMQAISQIFLVNIEGSSGYSAVEFCDDGTPLVPGGALLFSFNIGGSPREVAEFISSINSYCDRNSLAAPYVALDQEGGDVSRLRGISSPLPSSREVSEKMTASQAHELYSLQARQMRALGISMNLSPVAEPLLPSNSSFLETRSFGSPAETCAYSVAEILACEKNGVAAVAKHFPGNANTDPHSGLPEIIMENSEIERNFLLPFALVLRASPSCVLMSHAVVGTLDGRTPAALSEFWIRGVLKGRAGYGGLVISDDIFMGALADNGFPPESASVMALSAGTDIIMLSEKKFARVAKFLLGRAERDKALASRILDAERRVVEFKLEKGVLREMTRADGSREIVNGSLCSEESLERRLSEFLEAREAGVKMHGRFF